MSDVQYCKLFQRFLSLMTFVERPSNESRIAVPPLISPAVTFSIGAKERRDGRMRVQHAQMDNAKVPLDFGIYTSIFCVFYFYFFHVIMYVFNCTSYCVSWNCFACTFVTQLIKIDQSINQSIKPKKTSNWSLLFYSTMIRSDVSAMSYSDVGDQQMLITVSTKFSEFRWCSIYKHAVDIQSMNVFLCLPLARLPSVIPVSATASNWAI